MGEDFAQPLKKLAESGIGVAAEPTAGMGLALGPDGKIPWSAIPNFVAQELASSGLTVTTSAQDVPGCSVELGIGTYLVFATFDMEHAINGGGVLVGSLVVGSTTQAQQALLKNTGSANGDRATVTQVYVFTIGETFTVKMQAAKTVNAGTVQVNQTHSVLTYMKLA